MTDDSDFLRVFFRMMMMMMLQRLGDKEHVLPYHDMWHPPFVVDMLVSYPKAEHFGIRNDSIIMTLLKFNIMQELG